MTRIINCKEIDKNKWENRIKNDSENFLKEIGTDHDKKGIIGEYLFDLSLDNQEADLGYRSVSTVSGETTAKGMLNALCPELECFVTVINWMGTAEDRKETRREYHLKLNEFVKENDPNKVCLIKGNYRIKEGEFSTIILFRGDVEITQKNKNFYEWERVPFLKRTSDTFICYPSPVFMSTIKSNEKNVSEDRLYYFCAPVVIKSVNNNSIKIEIISGTSPEKSEAEVFVYNDELVNRLKLLPDIMVMGLFEDKIFYRAGNYEREIVLLNISDELDGNDIVGHLLVQRMYYKYLENLNLRICSDNELTSRYEIISFQTKKTYGKDANMQFDFFVKSYLEAFFMKIGDYWYYKPYIFKDLMREEYIEFIEKIYNNKSSNNTLETLKLKRKYLRLKNGLKFINAYNLFSKRTQIDHIRFHTDLEGKSRWRI